MKYTINYTFDGIIRFHLVVEADTPEEAKEQALQENFCSPYTTPTIISVVPTYS